MLKKFNEKSRVRDSVHKLRDSLVQDERLIVIDLFMKHIFNRKNQHLVFVDVSFIGRITAAIKKTY